METISNGIYDNISIEDYHANRSHISATSIKEAKASLKQFDWHRRGKMGQKTGKQLDFGNAFELALLDKDNFNKHVAIMQDEYWIALANEGRTEKYASPRASAKYKAERSKFETENAGKYFIEQSGEQSYESIEEMLTSCYSDPTIKKLIDGTEYQLSLFWTDEETGLNLKTRPDICKRKKNVIVNLKTCEKGDPKTFSRELAKWDYPLQAAIEIKGCIASGLMPQVDNYFWLVVEKSKPYNATIYEFIESDIRSTTMELEYYLNKIAEAEKTGIWPGYTQQADNKHGILQAQIPLWYKNI